MGSVPCASRCGQAGCHLSEATAQGRPSPLPAARTRLRAIPGTSPRLSAGHLHFLPGQIQAPQVQQRVHLPALGLWHRLAHGPVLHAVHPGLGLHQGVEDRGDTARGEQPGRRGQRGRLGSGAGRGDVTQGGAGCARRAVLVSVSVATGVSGSPLPHLGHRRDENVPQRVSWGRLASSSMAGVHQHCCVETWRLSCFP